MLGTIIALSMTLNTSAPPAAAVPTRAVASSVTAGRGDHNGGNWGDWSAARSYYRSRAGRNSYYSAAKAAKAAKATKATKATKAAKAAKQSAPASAAESSFRQCVISRESGGNPTAVNPTTGAGGLYQFLPSTWASLGYSGLPQNAPVSVQNQAFAKLYAQAGTSPWAPYDGC